MINGIKVNFTVHLGFEKGESGILYVLCKAARLGFIDVEYVNECVKNIYSQLYREHEDYNLLCPGYAMLRCSIDFGTGFRVIIVIEANSYVNTRSSRLLPKFKIRKMNGWCTV